MKIRRPGSTRIKPAQPVPQLTRRRFCFLGVGVAIVGALDPRALLPRYKSASNDGRWFFDGYRLHDNGPRCPEIGIDRMRCETVYFDQEGREIFRIADEQLRLMKDGGGQFYGGRNLPTLAELTDRFGVPRYLRAEWRFGGQVARRMTDPAWVEEARKAGQLRREPASYVHQPIETGAELARSRAQDRRIAAFIRGEGNADHPVDG